MNDYFAENALFQVYYFRRRFRMHKPLFLRIVEKVFEVSEFIRQAPDARGTLGFSSIQKCTAVLRMLAYGTPPDALDENFRMSALVARESLHEFCRSILYLYKERYLRRPTFSDIQQLYAHHATVHGFPSMLGSLDCMHWRWNMCPYALAGQYTKGNIQHPTVVLEAVASQDLWFWHGYFGSPGSINDINILGNSPLLSHVLNGTAPDSSYTLRGKDFNFGYYLVDGIYPELSVFVKTLACPNDPPRNKYKRAQEKARKDIERAFGALKKRWHIVAKPSLFRDISTMQEVMYTCMILHNMILEDECNAICQYDADEVIPETQPIPYDSPEYEERMRLLYNATLHTELRHHVTDHI